MRPRLLLPAAVSAALGALVWLAFAPAHFLNYDTEYALLWGADVVHGRTPDYELTLAPTPHPLAELLGALLALPGLGAHAPYGGFAEGAWEALAFLFLGILGWLVFALGRAWFGAGAGAVAAVLVLTREPVLSYGVRAYVDIPYLCLLLGALLVETRRRRAGTPVLVLLALAGLLRPEAWLFSIAYLWWLWRGGALRPAHVALAVASPILWALSDLAVTGNPMHSLTGTRESAGELGRVTGLQHVPATLPRRLGEVLREPVLVGAAGGGLLALWRLRDRALLGAIAGVVAVAGFCVLAAAGLPIITRYVLLPATILALFCGAGVLGWTQLAPDDPWRRPWIAFAAVTTILLALFGPSQAHRIDRTRAALVTQTHILGELRDLSPRAPRACPVVTLPNRRGIPQLALWTDRRPASITSAQDEGRYREPAFTPTSPDVARQFVLDVHDAKRTLPPPPAGEPTAAATYWLFFARGDCA